VLSVLLLLWYYYYFITFRLCYFVLVAFVFCICAVSVIDHLAVAHKNKELNLDELFPCFGSYWLL
jgi:hypothetical protein